MMTPEEQTFWNMQFQAEFTKYLVEHPDFDEKIPNDAHIIFLPENNPELLRENMNLADQVRHEGGQPIFVHVKGLLPDKSRLIAPTIETDGVVYSLRSVSTTINELESVVLTHDIQEHGLRLGDIGTVVHCYEDGSTFEVEFVTAEGQTVAVLTLSQADIRLMAAREILHVREMPASYG
jgi:hypothetical protein